MTQVKELDTLDKVSAKMMKRVKSTMHDDQACSYYVADDDVDKLDRLVTAYGKRTGSSIVNHKNFRLVRISNGIVNMRDLRDRIQKKLKADKAKGDVDDAITNTRYLDALSTFDFEFKYGADNMPATTFYDQLNDHDEDPDDEIIPQLNQEDVIKDILNNSEQYLVGPDIVYLFLTDLRNNFIPKH